MKILQLFVYIFSGVVCVSSIHQLVFTLVSQLFLIHILLTLLSATAILFLSFLDEVVNVHIYELKSSVYVSNGKSFFIIAKDLSLSEIFTNSLS